MVEAATFLEASKVWLKAIERLRAAVGPNFSAAVAVRDRPPRLYHFTDCEGLVGIVQSKTLRASLATALKDPSEVEYGVDRARKLINEHSLPAKYLPLDRVEQLLKHRQVEWKAYVVSFCETENTALHWLHYGRSGSGVAIGCDSDALERGVFKLFPILYSEEEQTALFTSVVDTVDGILAEYCPQLASSLRDRDSLLQIAAEIVADHFWLAAPIMKNPAYTAEQEWRLIAFHPKGEGIPQPRNNERTWFRSTAGRIVPYKECGIEVTPNFEIVLGFSSPIKDGDPALSLLMEEQLDRQIQVRRSAIPVRS